MSLTSPGTSTILCRCEVIRASSRLGSVPASARCVRNRPRRCCRPAPGPLARPAARVLPAVSRIWSHSWAFSGVQTRTALIFDARVVDCGGHGWTHSRRLGKHVCVWSPELAPAGTLFFTNSGHDWVVIAPGGGRRVVTNSGPTRGSDLCVDVAGAEV